MDFFASQDRARASTRRLIVLYTLALGGLIVSLDAVAVILVGIATGKPHSSSRAYSPDVGGGPDVVAMIGIAILSTLCILAIVIVATLFKKIQIGGDGAKVAEHLGGREIVGAPTDLDEQKYVNVVEEMSLASGVAKPRLFVLDQEEGINAFAAGPRPEAAVVCVTRGTLTKLSRDELQGVIAHEFSHILNGDMRLNLRLISLNFGIMAIGYIGLQVLRFTPWSSRSSRSRDDGKDSGNAIFVILGVALAMMILGYLGTLFGKMLQAAVSRQREYLADASAVQFTRNPAGIEGALKKIGGFVDGSKLMSTHADEAAHMFFADGVAGFLDSVFATHPPLKARILAIDPNFDGTMIVRTDVDSPLDTSAIASGFAGATPPPLPAAGQTIAAKPEDLRAARTVIAPRELSFAAATLDALPNELLAAAREPYESRALAIALLLDADASLRASQLALVAKVEAPMAQLAEKLWPTVSIAGPAARLPLLDLAMPALRQLSPTQRKQFRALCQACADADGQLSAFELALSCILDDQLPEQPAAARPAPRFASVTAVAEPAATILSALASAGGEAQADAAFAAGAARLGINAMPARAGGYDAQRLGSALNAVRDATPAVQQRIVDAAAYCVAADRVVRIEEIELMRALCAAFAVPIPPFLQYA